MHFSFFFHLLTTLCAFYIFTILTPPSLITLCAIYSFPVLCANYIVCNLQFFLAVPLRIVCNLHAPEKTWSAAPSPGENTSTGPSKLRKKNVNFKLFSQAEIWRMTVGMMRNKKVDAR